MVVALVRGMGPCRVSGGVDPERRCDGVVTHTFVVKRDTVCASRSDPKTELEIKSKIELRTPHIDKI